ncbi:sulfur transferase domain-containing protein [Pseudoxanthomonas sp. UTMC 1351]|uniref:beta-lactamase hydrolase domain-containing protein n=1 Tax=Pseudoxanthomonas sp. UTMC 1351 TaxID=2695853 RepID=UPI0034CDD279
MNTSTLTRSAGFALALLLSVFAPTASATEFTEPKPGLHTGAQPTPNDLAALSRQGVRTVIDLRTDEEDRGFDEAAEVERQGMHYVRLPIGGADDLTAENATLLKQALDQSGDGVLLHCASGNRVGALLAMMAAQHEDATPAEALELGKRAGLKSLEPTVVEKLGATDSP